MEFHHHHHHLNLFNFCLLHENGIKTKKRRRRNCLYKMRFYHLTDRFYTTKDLKQHIMIVVRATTTKKLFSTNTHDPLNRNEWMYAGTMITLHLHTKKKKNNEWMNKRKKRKKSWNREITEIMIWYRSKVRSQKTHNPWI